MKMLLKYFMARRKFWLIPILLILCLAAILVIAGPANPYSPFIYSVF